MHANYNSTVTVGTQLISQLNSKNTGREKFCAITLKLGEGGHSLVCSINDSQLLFATGCKIDNRLKVHIACRSIFVQMVNESTLFVEVVVA